MKARRKVDGKIIEVETYMWSSRRCKDGSWESSYKDINSGLVYEAYVLDFNFNADTVIKGWVARKKEGDIFLYKSQPKRIYDGEYSRWEGDAVCTQPMPHELFPDLTWDDEPQEVEIIIKRKLNE